MPIMAARHYNNGQLVRELGPDEIIPEDCDTGDFFWLGLYEPTPGELETIAKRFGLHPLAVEDALKANQLPKVEAYGDQLFVIARTANLDGDTIEPGETAIFAGPHFLVTVRHGSARAHTAVRARLESLPLKLAHGLMYLMISMTALLAAIWVGLWFAGRFVAPIRRLIAGAQEISKGNLAVELPEKRGEGDQSGEHWGQLHAVGHIRLAVLEAKPAGAGHYARVAHH